MPSAMQELGIIAAAQAEFPRPAKWTFYLFMFSLVDRSCSTLCGSPGLEPVEKALLPQILAAEVEHCWLALTTRALVFSFHKMLILTHQTGSLEHLGWEPL